MTKGPSSKTSVEEFIHGAGGVGVVVVWLGLQFNKSLLVCVENSVCGEKGRLEPR